MTVEPLARNTPVSTPKSTAKPSRTHRTLRRGSATGARLVGAEDPPGPHGPGRCRGRLRRGRPPRLASRAELLLVGDGGSDRFVVEVVALGNLLAWRDHDAIDPRTPGVRRVRGRRPTRPAGRPHPCVARTKVQVRPSHSQLSGRDMWLVVDVEKAPYWGNGSWGSGAQRSPQPLSGGRA